VTRHKLAQYRKIVSEIEMLEEEIANAGCGKSTVVDYANDYSSGFPRPITLVGLGTDETPKKSERLVKLICEARELEAYVDSVTDTMTRQILYRRYIKGQTEEETGAAVGYCASHVRRIIQKHFAENMSVNERV
jgi:DNA-directed RNA polymerase specialized sigma subunit